MSEQSTQARCCGPWDPRQALSVHTQKVTDSCRDKDCIEDLRFYPTENGQARYLPQSSTWSPWPSTETITAST